MVLKLPSTRCKEGRGLWRKYKTHKLWLAFKDARCDYKSALYAAKTAVISDKVISCGKDSQKLYSLVNNLLGRGKRNCLPDCDSDADLANEFATFFLQKVERLKEGFAGYDKYVPPKRDAPIFGAFSTMLESKVLSILMRMPEKFCNLDPVSCQSVKTTGTIPY